jgi:hypothetical protein
LIVDLAQILCAFGGEIADGFVGVEPAPAGTDLEAVEEIVDCLIGGIQGMRVCVEVVVEDAAVAQTEDDEVAACGYLDRAINTRLSR